MIMLGVGVGGAIWLWGVGVTQFCHHHSVFVDTCHHARAQEIRSADVIEILEWFFPVKNYENHDQL